MRAAFVKSWDSYKRHAWLWDELTPLSGSRRNTFGGLGATLVDALDTLWIMDLRDDFDEAVRAVAALDYMKTADSSLNLFETVIRHLGGLLAAHDLSGSAVLLQKAVDLGDMLYAAFDTPNHLPPFWFSFDDARAGRQLAGTSDASAAPASLALEFTRLAQLTGDAKYYTAVDRVTRLLEATQQSTQLPGMWPRQMDFRHELAPGDGLHAGCPGRLAVRVPAQDVRPAGRPRAALRGPVPRRRRHRRAPPAVPARRPRQPPTCCSPAT